MTKCHNPLQLIFVVLSRSTIIKSHVRTHSKNRKKERKKKKESHRIVNRNGSKRHRNVTRECTVDCRLPWFSCTVLRFHFIPWKYYFCSLVSDSDSDSASLQGRRKRGGNWCLIASLIGIIDPSWENGSRKKGDRREINIT